MEGLWDLVATKTMVNESLSKPQLQGSPTQPSLIDLLRFKRQCLQHSTTTTFPKHGFKVDEMAEVGRRMSTFALYRQHVAPLEGGEVDTTWQSKLQDSTLLALRLLEDLVFTPTLNSVLVGLLKKKTKHPDDVTEAESWKLRWDECINKVNQDIAKEKATQQAASAGEVKDGDDELDEEDESARLAKGTLVANPGKYLVGSVERWTATAVHHLNIYTRFVAEPASVSGVVKLISESHMSNEIQGKKGRSIVLVHFDMNLFGEAATRPWARPAIPTEDLVKKLIHGALAGRGAPMEDGEVAKPLETDVVVINQGSVSQSLCHPFPKSGGCSHKEWLVCLSEGSVKERRRKYMGIVKQTQTYYFHSAEPLPSLIPEVQLKCFQGTNRGAVVAWAALKPVGKLWTETVAVKKQIYGPKVIGTATTGALQAPT